MYLRKAALLQALRHSDLWVAFCAALLFVSSSSCAVAGDLSRPDAERILNAYFSNPGAPTRDIPIGPQLHMSFNPAIDVAVPIRSDMVPVYREMERNGWIQMTKRGSLQGFGGQAVTYDVSLTPQGEKVLGPLQLGRPDYDPLPSIYPLPQAYVRLQLCKKSIKDITGIRVVTPGTRVEVEYTWHCPVTTPFAEMVSKVRWTRNPFDAKASAPGGESSGSTPMELYDDGWRIKPGR